MLKRILLGLVVLVLGLIAVVAGKTLLLQSRDVQVAAGDPVDINQQAAAERLAQSVRIKTISFGVDAPVEAEAFSDLHRFLQINYPSAHAVLKREVVNEYSLLYTWQGSDPSLEPILLMGHMDVVPIEPGTEGNWQHPPFSGKIADGAIWGRGTLDDKLAVLGPLEAVEYLLSQGVTPKRTVYLAFGHDEEIGGPNGAGHIAKLLKERGVRLAFTLDEGSVVAHNIVPGVEKPVALVGLAEKGYLSLRLTAKAVGGHSSMPPASTAVGKLARAIDSLQSNPFPAQLKTPASEMFDYLAPEMPIAMRAVFANRWLLDPVLKGQLEASAATNAMIRTTTAPTVLRGGVKDNVLPSEATATINFRILPGETVESVTSRVKEVIDDPDVAVSKYGDNNDPSPVSSADSDSFMILQRTIRQAMPDTVVAPSLVIAGTDSKHYAAIADNSFRFLPMRLGPEDLSRIHGTNERITLENYAEVIRFYVYLLRNGAL